MIKGREDRAGMTVAAIQAALETRKLMLSVNDVQTVLGYSKRSFYLLRSDPTEAFPAPFVVAGRDRWWIRDIVEWCEARRRKDAVPGRTALAPDATGRVRAA